MNLLRHWLQSWIDEKTQEMRLVQKKAEAVIAFDRDRAKNITIAEYYQRMEKAIEEVE